MKLNDFNKLSKEVDEYYRLRNLKSTAEEILNEMAGEYQKGDDVYKNTNIKFYSQNKTISVEVPIKHILSYYDDLIQEQLDIIKGLGIEI